jgi:hypothetical protein
VTVIALLLTELLAVVAHFYAVAFPPAELMQLFEGLALFWALVMAPLSIVLLVVIIRIRRVRPPPGLAFFGAVVAVAPWVVVLLRLMTG